MTYAQMICALSRTDFENCKIAVCIWKEIVVKKFSVMNQYTSHGLQYRKKNNHRSVNIYFHTTYNYDTYKP
jgi:hypothetical protein